MPHLSNQKAGESARVNTDPVGTRSRPRRRQPLSRRDVATARSERSSHIVAAPGRASARLRHRAALHCVQHRQIVARLRVPDEIVRSDAQPVTTAAGDGRHGRPHQYGPRPDRAEMFDQCTLWLDRAQRIAAGGIHAFPPSTKIRSGPVEVCNGEDHIHVVVSHLTQRRMTAPDGVQPWHRPVQYPVTDEEPAIGDRPSWRYEDDRLATHRLRPARVLRQIWRDLRDPGSRVRGASFEPVSRGRRQDRRTGPRRASRAGTSSQRLASPYPAQWDAISLH